MTSIDLSSGVIWNEDIVNTTISKIIRCINCGNLIYICGEVKFKDTYTATWTSDFIIKGLPPSFATQNIQTALYDPKDVRFVPMFGIGKDGALTFYVRGNSLADCHLMFFGIYFTS